MENLPIFTKCETPAPTPITICHIYWWQIQNILEMINPSPIPTTTNTTNLLAINTIHHNHTNRSLHPHPTPTTPNTTNTLSTPSTSQLKPNIGTQDPYKFYLPDNMMADSMDSGLTSNPDDSSLFT